MNKKWSDEIFIAAVKNSLTKTEILKKLNLNTRNSGNFQTVNKHILRLGLNTSHFTDKCYERTFQIRNLKDILIENSDYNNTQNLKKRLIKNNLLFNKCYETGCSISSLWNGKKINLQLDHINGIRTDNRLENLRLLCPNCHSQTETYCRGTRKTISSCNDCGTKITKHYQYCRKCSAIHKQKKYKILWPPIDEVVRLVSKLGYSATGKLLKVTDNSVRKYIQQNTDEKTFLSLRKRKPRKRKI